MLKTFQVLLRLSKVPKVSENFHLIFKLSIFCKLLKLLKVRKPMYHGNYLKTFAQPTISCKFKPSKLLRHCPTPQHLPLVPWKKVVGKLC